MTTIYAPPLTRFQQNCYAEIVRRAAACVDACEVSVSWIKRSGGVFWMVVIHESNGRSHWVQSGPISQHQGIDPDGVRAMEEAGKVLAEQIHDSAQRSALLG